MSNKKNASNIIKVTEEKLINPQTEEYSNTEFGSEAKQFSLNSFRDNLDINIISLDDEEAIFDVTGIDPPLANSLRRILISEIPTMAIEIVNVFQNTSVIPDEVLCHRLGLIPILANANDFEYKKDNEEFNENNSLHFKLHVKCERRRQGDKEEITNEEVLSNKIIWNPIGNQAKNFVGENIIKVVFDDILVAKMRPGQEIEADFICVKGIGRTHAKWSPVSTAFYRLLPNIEFKQEIIGENAEELKKICPVGVYDVEESGKAFVKNARICTTCRECIRNPKFKDIIELQKIKDHYEFHIESVGIYKPEFLFFKALEILKEKCEMWSTIVGEKSSNERKMSINK